MRRALALLAALAVVGAAPALAQPAAPGPTAGAPKKPGKKPAADTAAKQPRGKEPKPYVPPVLDPEPAPEASKDAAVEARSSETGVFARPWYPSPRIGTLASGTRLKVRGQVASRPKERLCGKAIWYAVEPFGWVCRAHVKPTAAAPTTEPVFRMKPGERLPYRYGMVKKGTKANQFASVDDIDGNNVQRQLTQHDTVAVTGTLEHNGTRYIRTADGYIVEAENVAMMGGGSEWHGVELKADQKLPFAWVRTDKAKVLPEPNPKAKPVDKLARRTRVEIVEEVGDAKARFWKLADGRFVAAGDLNVVRKIAPPEGVLTSPEKQWIDVDLGEQVLVLYEHTTPVYATVVSTGRSVKTPRGNYPIWARVLATTMKNQSYEDGSYHMARVPWVLFFQTHNAIHGCYWHGDYGAPRSHGCVNTSPIDVRHVFDWIRPKLPPGWFGMRPANLLESVTVHVRNSKLTPAWVQERPIGPPDKEVEKKKLDWAEKRRAEKAEAAAKAAAKPPGAAPAPAP
ncbi:MAG TPA: L,D-transpeptidase [Polyangia bacterium]|jgi:lipoprotein-anchoring transpeptidase ErfK/SrfK